MIETANANHSENLELVLKVSGPEFVASCNRIAFVAREKLYRASQRVTEMPKHEAVVLLLHLLCKAQSEGFDIGNEAVKCLERW